MTITEALVAGAIRSHNTDTSDGEWDAEAARRNLPSEESALREAHAWAGDGNPSAKSNYSGLHHNVTQDGAVGAANLTACTNGIHALNRADSAVPASHRAAVYAHLHNHLLAGGRSDHSIPALRDKAEAGVEEPVTAAADEPAAKKKMPDDEMPMPMPEMDTNGVTYRQWRALAVTEGVWTGDDRFIEPQALTWRDFPLPLMAQTETAPGHDGARLVGRIDAAERTDASAMVDARTGKPYGAGAQAVMLSGVIDSDQDAEAIASKIAGGFLRGVSVDLSDVEYVDELTDADGNVIEDPEEAIDSGDVDPTEIRLRSRITAGRIMGLCYDDQTEILTETRGWRSFADLDRDDRVATRNQKNGEFEWALPTYYHHDRWTGRMIRFSGRNLDLLVTPNHRMYVAPVVGGPTEIVTAEELVARGATAYRVPLTSEWTAPDVTTVRIERESQPAGLCACGCGEPVGTRGDAAPQCAVDGCDRLAYVRTWCNQHYQRWRRHGDPTAGGPLRKVRPNARLTGGRTALPGHGHGLKTEPLVFEGDDFAAFMGAYLAEGSCSTTKGVCISQMPTSKGFAMYEALLSRMFRSHYHDGKGFRVTSSRLREYLRQFGLAGEKFVPDLVKNMSARQLQIFLDHYLAGDGTKMVRGNHTRWSAVTVSRRLAEDLQEIAQKIGLSASVRVRVRNADNRVGDRIIRKENIRPIYSVVLRTSHLAPIWKAEAVDDYDGDVRCVSVPNEILYVRRNGYPIWCGNTVTPFPAFEGAYIELLGADGEAGPSTGPGQPTREQAAAAIHDVTTLATRTCEPCEADPLTAAAAPVLPPKAWFANPKLAEPTPVTVTDEGQVYGHLALWPTCHIGISGRCVTPPHSATNYALYNRKPIPTADGDEVLVGPLTVGTGHADTRPGTGMFATIAHYDNTGTCAADLTAGEDEHGIWVAGALRPDATPEHVRMLRASSVSGDWRDWGGHLELGAILAVNTPGFPVLRQVVASGRPMALIAAGPRPDATPPELAELRDLLPDVRAAAERERAVRERETAALTASAEGLRTRMRTSTVTDLRSRMRRA